MQTWLELACAPEGERVVLLVESAGRQTIVFARLKDHVWRSEDGAEIEGSPVGWWPLAAAQTPPPCPINPL